ncbi:COQ9 family protein [Plastoroseomonas arctica]|uniref:COQ9 family protein n=1 Tax=Plastoroseomonas arctica TaxID=1509237 RepID=A0AAF1KLP8_9PROT|nr:COQ9 family protein [Plastoroseomonas arctica]MBR0655001.1 COQ9 family protein [Plastoroseomonas arctica]
MPIEQSPERDAALRAALPHVARLGWGRAALRAGLADIGADPESEAWLFPRGAIGAIEAWLDLADRDMAASAEAEGLSAMRVPARIRRLVLLRLEQATPHREAVRRALGRLAFHPGVAIRAAARTADAMWNAAGDASADFSWYTRRASLAGVYGATLAYWLRREDPDLAETAAFLQRRLDDLARLSRRRKRDEPLPA